MSENDENQKEIEKKVSPDQKTVRLGELGSPWLRTSGGLIREIQKKDLQYPQAIHTYDNMALDDTVGAVLNLTNVFISNKFAKAKFTPGDPKSEKSQRFTDFLNWNMQNLKYQTWWDVIQNILPYTKYGYSILQKVYETNTSAEYSEFPYKIKKLSPVNAASVYRWAFTKQYREIAGFWQLQTGQVPQVQGSIPVTVLDPANPQQLFRRQKFMLFNWDSTNNNPEGRSPLASVYKIWQEIQWIRDFEVVGVSRDLGGIPVLRLPAEIINKAAADPNSPEAETVKSLETSAANMRAGDQAYVLLASDTMGDNGNGAYQYDIALQGTDGAGKNYNTDKLIDQRVKAIYDAFGAKQLYLGKDGGGSYALAENENTIHAHYMRKHEEFISQIFRNDLLPQFAEINGFTLTEDEMPHLVPDETEPVSLDEAGKMIQRAVSVGALVMSKENIINYHDRLGFDTAHMEDMTQQQLSSLMTASTSRAGEGNGTSGTGSSQEGGSSSDNNSDNAE